MSAAQRHGSSHGHGVCLRCSLSWLFGASTVWGIVQMQATLARPVFIKPGMQ